MARSISTRANSGFVRAVRYSAGTPARSNRARLLVQLSGRNSRNASMTGTSPRASVSDTRVWQFAVLPSAEAYCAATPTECVPFLGIAVSSITSTASLPPTSLRNGLVYLWETMPAFARRQRMLSPLPAFTKRQQLLQKILFHRRCNKGADQFTNAHAPELSLER